MMARLHTGNHDVLMLRNAYHGGLTDALLGTLGHSTWKFNLPTVRHAAVELMGARSPGTLQTYVGYHALFALGDETSVASIYELSCSDL